MTGRWFVTTQLLLITAAGCAAPVPTGRDLMTLHWPGREAIGEEQAVRNNDIRMALWDAYNAGRMARARKPMTTIEGDPMDQYLVVHDESGSRLIVDSRRDRYAGDLKILTFPITGMRIGYFKGGDFIETTQPPPDGREMFLLIATDSGGEFRY